VTIIVNITGSLLDKVSGITKGKNIIAVYPAIIGTIGGVGSIIGSTATTKLALGLSKPSFLSIKKHINEISGAWLASIILFTVYVMLSSFINSSVTLGSIVTFTSQLLTINVIAVLVMIFIAYIVAIYTFRRGWNPDNFVIPIESSLADTVTTAAVLVVLVLIA
jgi:mgtE-like transporter